MFFFNVHSILRPDDKAAEHMVVCFTFDNSNGTLVAHVKILYSDESCCIVNVLLQHI